MGLHSGRVWHRRDVLIKRWQHCPRHDSGCIRSCIPADYASTRMEEWRKLPKLLPAGVYSHCALH